MQFKKIQTLMVSLAFIIAMTPTFAKEEEKNDGLARVVFITAKDGQSKALRDAITDYHHYMADKEGAWRYKWFIIETGPHTGKFIARSGGLNWADFDAEFDWEKEADAKFAKDVAPFIGNATVSITKSNQKLGIWPESLEGYNYFQITQWHIKSGKDREFNEGLKKIDGILKKGDWPNYYAFSNTVSGGQGNTMLLVSPRKNFADMADKEPGFISILNKSMGEKKAEKFLAGWSKTYQTGSYYMLRYLERESNYDTKKK